MERILTLNIGATRLALAEFEVRPGKSPALLRYAFGALPDGMDTPEALGLGVEETLRGMLAESGMKPGRMMVAISGQQAFPRFVKVFCESEEKMREQIRFEVEQNVPFSLDEAIWSDALVGPAIAGEQHVMIVAARKDTVGAITKALINTGMEPELVDVAPVALYNAVRFNYNDTSDCTLVVDIGAKCTNLVFIEQDRIFYRTIPVAGNTITAEIARAFGISTEEAEQLKCTQGLVAQGGAFVIDDPKIDQLSKVIRNVMTRLHAEVARSISFYRSQQDGNAPTRILLTGASAQMPYMQNFFEEKLQIAVEFLNPFLAVAYPEMEDSEQFGRDAFALPALVGLALRRGLTCPVEVNLVSEDIVARKAFRKRVPFLMIAAVGLVFIFGIWLIFINNMSRLYSEQYQKTQERVDECTGLKDRYDRTDSKAKAAEARASSYQQLMAKRKLWPTMLTSLTTAMPKGLWISSLKSHKEGNEIDGLDVTINAWKDLENRLSAPGKTIDETVVAALIATDAFGTDVTISKKQQSEWMTSFNITAKGNAPASPKTTSRRKK